jgi:predicted nuclease with TOPRIM domain
MTNQELFEDLKQYIDGRFNQVEDRFEKIDARFEQIDAKFGQIDAKFDQIDARFDKLDAKIDSLRTELIDGMNQQTETIVRHIDSLEHRHSARLDDHEMRIGALENAR